MYLGGVIAILVIIIIMNILIMNYSMKGSIMDVRARKSVPILLYIRYEDMQIQQEFNTHNFESIFFFYPFPELFLVFQKSCGQQ